MVISSKSLSKMARNWLDMAVVGTARTSCPRSNSQKNSKESCRASKGYFVVSSSDWNRFAIPLSYLRNDMIQELFKMSEEEFGLPREGLIRIPCDSLFIHSIVLTIQKGVAAQLEESLTL